MIGREVSLKNLATYIQLCPTYLFYCLVYIDRVLVRARGRNHIDSTLPDTANVQEAFENRTLAFHFFAQLKIFMLASRYYYLPIVKSCTLLSTMKYPIKIACFV